MQPKLIKALKALKDLLDCPDLNLGNLENESQKAIDRANTTLNELNAKGELVMPICPYCKEEMEPFDYRGYYDSFVGWECACEKIPKAQKRVGEYA